jgi:hypothetical protein
MGSLAFILLGGALEYVSPAAMMDFKGLYYPARCLIQHCDPYKRTEVLRMYQAEGGDHALDNTEIRLVATQNPYPPTTFSFTVPFAILPWGLAHTLWMALVFGTLLFASFLTWDLAADYAPILSGVLIGFLLANTELLVITGNMAGIAISLSVGAVWCFLRKRFIPVGILCLAISLAVKPHDTGFVWLYFFLAGGVYRKRALQTLLVTTVISLPMVLWAWHVAPNWVQELHSNILAYSAHGGIAAPGSASTGARGLGMMVNLQTVFSVFWDDPRIYNPASYLVFAPLLLLWAFLTLRSRPSLKNAWLALAAISALTMLPVYHELMDTKLLLLTIPACAMLWAEGGRIGRLALLVITAGFVLTGDIPWAILLRLISILYLPATGLSGQILMALHIFPVPLILLVVGIFYLWVYVRACSDLAPQSATEPYNGLQAF